MKTYMATSQSIDKKWYLIDGNGKTVGRIATKIATILRGKDVPQFTPHAGSGGFIVVINAEKVRFTGKKWSQKTYYSHSPYPGGIKSITAENLLKKEPEKILKNAVWGMLPRNKWQKKLISRLKVYSGAEHPHAPQKPEILEV